VRAAVAARGLVAGRALGGVRRAGVRAGREQLGEQEGEDHLAGELGVRAGPRLRAQEQLPSAVSHSVQSLIHIRCRSVKTWNRPAGGA
jgi:hypothetical protein